VEQDSEEYVEYFVLVDFVGEAFERAVHMSGSRQVDLWHGAGVWRLDELGEIWRAPQFGFNKIEFGLNSRAPFSHVARHPTPSSHACSRTENSIGSRKIGYEAGRGSGD
jgi:hypothetical protein